MSRASRNKRPYVKSRGTARARTGCPCSYTCCERAAPVSFEWLALDRGEDIYALRDETGGETRWWFECWTCGDVCRCEV